MKRRIIVKKVSNGRCKTCFCRKNAILVVSLLALVLILGWGVNPRNNSIAEGSNIQEYREVIVKPGDNLWVLAERYGDPRMDTR